MTSPATPTTHPSPILLLSKSIAAAAFNIVPERAQDLAADPDLKKFSLRFSDEAKFKIRVNTETHLATLPTAALEYLWCCAHTFWVLHQEYVLAQSRGENQFDWTKVTRVVRSLETLSWSIRNLIAPQTERRPTGRPRPRAHPKYASDNHVANELFLCAIAFIIHHEMAHVKVATSGDQLLSLYSVENEKAADLTAIDWIMGKSSVSAETQKRQLGVVTAVMAMLLLDRQDDRGGNYVLTHPRPIERLFYSIDAMHASDDSAVCGFAAVALQFELYQRAASGTTVALEGSSIRDILDGFMAAYAAAIRN